MRGFFKLLTIVCFINILMPLLGMAQIPGEKVYTQLDGYPGGTGYVVSQDEKGFIWIGTDNGVARFDGRNFTAYDAKDGLHDKEVLKVIPMGNEQLLFIPLLNNIALFDKGKIYIQEEHPELAKVNNKSLNQLYVDNHNGTVWITDHLNDGQVYRFKDGLVESVQIDLPLDFEVTRVHNDVLYVSLVDSLKYNYYPAVYHIDTREYHPLLLENGDPIPFCHRNAWDTEGKYFAVEYANKNAVHVYALQEKGRLHLIKKFSSKGLLRLLFFDQYDHLWAINDGKGMSYLGTIEADSSSVNPGIAVFPNKVVNHVFVDRDHHVWVSTKSGGLHFVSRKHWAHMLLTQPLHLPAAQPIMGTSYKNQQVLLVYPQSNQIWTVSSKGVSTSSPIGASYNKGVKFIKAFSEGVLLTTPLNSHFLRYNENQLEEAFSIIGPGSIKDVADGFGNQFLLACHNAVYGWDVGIPRKQADFSPSHLYQGRSTCLGRFSDTKFFIGTPSGLRFYDSHLGCSKPSEDQKLKGIHITYLKKASANHFLVGTSTRGLYEYFVDADSSHLLLSPKDLNSAAVNQIEVGPQGAYWLATDRGIFKLELDTNLNSVNTSRYTFFDGLPSNNVSGIHFMDKSLYAITDKGLGVLPVELLEEEGTDAVPKVYVTQVKTDDTLLYFPDKVDLSFPKSNLSLSLSTILFESLGQISYRYRLKGVNDTWLETKGDEINLSYLPPQEHQLEVILVDHRGKEHPGLVLPIHVEPAYWQTLWFKAAVIALAAVVLLLLIFTWSRWYKLRLYKKSQQERKLAELELEAIKAQINPHFISNCLNSIQYFHLKKQFKEASQYLDLFASLIHHTMRYSQETFITLDEEIDYLSNYLLLEKMRFKNSLTYSIEVQSPKLRAGLVPAMLIQPFVENALKHGIPVIPKIAEVKILFESSADGGVRVFIRDNGPGITEQKKIGKRKPLGTRIASKRASTYGQLFKLDIAVEVHNLSAADESIQGTEVQLKIPAIDYANSQV